MIIEIFIILIMMSFSSLITLFLIPVGYGYHYFAPISLLPVGYLLGVGISWCLLFLFALPYKNKRYENPSLWANFWLSEAEMYVSNHAGVVLKINQKASLPNERYLLICNHLSKFDPMILSAKYGKSKLAFISKPTNFKIPIGHRFMWGANYLAIDRYDKLQSLQIMKEAAQMIKEDKSNVGVFPEGTRSETGELGPFHEGVFSIALQAKCPIVITSFKGTENIKKNFPKRLTPVTLNIIEVLYPENYEGMIAKELSDYCYNRIKETVSQ